MKRLFLLSCVAGFGVFPVTLRAHVGSPNVFFEGRAGPYPVHVVIKPAEVIPGLAEISVRVDSGTEEKVTALPIKWNAGRQGAPPPDVARLVRGETNLYSAQLWFMEPGAQSVELEITGGLGPGHVIIPVDAIARRVLTMPKGLGALLVVLGLILAGMLLGIIGAAVRESVLGPGVEPHRRRRWYARGAITFGALLLALLLWGGKHWWNAEAADYRNDRLYRPLAATANVRTEQGRQTLRLEINDPAFSKTAPLVPDHGKLMHLFLIREPKLDAFAHLHPIKRDRQTFETDLPQLPGGTYKAYADVTYETGFSDTVTATVNVPGNVIANQNDSARFDPDDSWRLSPELGTNRNRDYRLSPDLVMTFEAPPRIMPNHPLTLHFSVRQSNGNPVALDSYLGMRGHLALRRDDGSVFTHLHPGGSASMAAMQLAVFRIEGKLPLKAAFGADEPLCQLPAATERELGWMGGSPPAEGVSFPYAFPKPGLYRVWVQVKAEGKVLTGVFDLDVLLTGER